MKLTRFDVLRNFFDNRKGAAIIEFLLSLPVSLLVFAILHDVGRMILIKSRVTHAASNIADILSQTVDKKELAVPWIDQHGIGGPNGQTYLMMGQIFMFPDKTPNPIYSYYDTNAPIGVGVLTSGTDGQSWCIHTERGRRVPSIEMDWTPGSRHPEVVVGVAFEFRLPLLSGPFGIGWTPTMTLWAVERRRMRSVLVSGAGNVRIRPLYSKKEHETNPICNPPD